MEESDLVGVYEGKAERRPTTLDAGMAALGSSLDRVQQVEALHRKSGNDGLVYILPTLLLAFQPFSHTSLRGVVTRLRK